MPTVSRKSERLVNLTIALLATGRWLTKSEIFRSIDGYDGDAEAKERMFERDKEELRNLGIEIEVGSFDALFDDEVGYRIRPEKYRINIPELTPIQLALLSSAAQSWRDAALNSQAASALVKLKSLGIESDVEEVSSNPLFARNSDENLIRVIDAIAAKKSISFTYRGSDYSQENRVIDPYGVGTKNGFWYMAGRDLDKKEIRLFRLDRCASEIKEQGRANSYEIPSEFSMQDQLASRERKLIATLLVRSDKAHSLRRYGRVISSAEEWDTLEYSYADESELLSDLLWHMDDVIIQEPVEIVKNVQAAIKNIRVLHG